MRKPHVCYQSQRYEACHHIRVDRLDYLLKLYVQKVMGNSASMLEQLNSDLAKEQEEIWEETYNEIEAEFQKKIKVYEDHLELLLKADMDALIRCGTVEMAANFDAGIKGKLD